MKTRSSLNPLSDAPLRVAGVRRHGALSRKGQVEKVIGILLLYFVMVPETVLSDEPCDYTRRYPGYLSSAILDEAEDEDDVMPLLRRGADIESVNVEGMTPLLVAVYHQHRNVVRTLVHCGADVNARSNIGFTPLILAANDPGGTLQWLLAAGADRTSRADNGVNALKQSVLCVVPNNVRRLLAEGQGKGGSYSAEEIEEALELARSILRRLGDDGPDLSFLDDLVVASGYDLEAICSEGSISRDQASEIEQIVHLLEGAVK